ncbi:MAG TPA: hypothetical protein VFU21_32505 [Kofleriaceae bacterium]|nr:hypothetical protein [Kofleriaceae bacterium]
MRPSFPRRIPMLLGGCLVGCAAELAPEPIDQQPDRPGMSPIVVPDEGPVAAVSVASMDRARRGRQAADLTAPLEARLLVLSAGGQEPELGAIRSILDHRGVPHEVFVAVQEPPLTADRLRSGERGLYQGIVLTSSALAIAGTSTLSAAEWAVLADYEQAFGVRRAVLAAWADPALGFGPATTVNTGTTPVAIACTAAGLGVFRDVNCDLEQEIRGGRAYLSRPASGAPLTPLLTDAGGNALAAVHTAGDGRESLLLLFRNQADRIHSQQFLHGVLGWVSGGTYLGERRIDFGIQVDDFFFGSDHRMTGADLRDALAWLNRRRARAITPDFRVSLAFNGEGAGDGDPLTAAAVAQDGEWFWINHTYGHAGLDDISYADALEEYTLNNEVAADLPLVPFDVRNLVTGNVSGLVNPDAMQAAYDAGIRFAVTDTSVEGCDNPSPNSTFYNVMGPGILLVPRRPGEIPWRAQTPDEWVDHYNGNQGDLTYPQVVQRVSSLLLRHLLRGDADPWMFHQANLRAYDGTHSILGDLADRVVARYQRLLRVPVRTLPMEETGLRFARRLDYETAGVRATLFRGRALVIDAGRALSVPVTGVRPEDGEAYGGDVIGLVAVTPETSTCVPLDSDGLGCSPAPVREGGPGPTSPLPVGYCDASSLPHTSPLETAIARGSEWLYWDQGGLGTAWRAGDYDDSLWASGAGPLGYGEGYLATTVSYGGDPDHKHITTYFRRGFTLENPEAVAVLRGELMHDDGAVVYLNGVEIGRASMPAGTVTSTTLAMDHEAGNSHAAFDWSAHTGLLVAGSNTVAVEVHQASPSSSDVVFDLALLVGGGSAAP